MNDQNSLTVGAAPFKQWLELWMVANDAAVCIGAVHKTTFDSVAAVLGILASAPFPFAITEVLAKRNGASVERKSVKTGVFAPDQAMESAEQKAGTMANRIAALTCDMPPCGHGFYRGDHAPDELNIRAIVAEVLEP